METPAVEELLDLGGRVALVTGAGSGIGSTVARRIAEAGADVAVHYRSSAEGAERTVAAIEEGGGRAVAIRADVTRPGRVEELFAACVDRLGVPTVLVNNAGSYPVSSLLAMEPEEWDEVVRVNLHAVHHCTRAAALRMIEGGEEGVIVNVSSIEGEEPMAGHAHYNAAKAGVGMYTRTAATELGEHGIRVNAVAPGVIRREGIEEAWPEGVAAWRESCPLTRLGEASDVADACLFLASPAARWITGATLRVDGGFLSRGLMRP